jgi:hypothetical protein
MIAVTVIVIACAVFGAAAGFATVIIIDRRHRDRRGTRMVRQIGLASLDQAITRLEAERARKDSSDDESGGAR